MKSSTLRAGQNLLFGYLDQGAGRWFQMEFDAPKATAPHADRPAVLDDHALDRPFSPMKAYPVSDVERPSMVIAIICFHRTNSRHQGQAPVIVCTWARITLSKDCASPSHALR